MSVKLSEIARAIDAFAPFATAEEWDNSGCQIGSPQTTVTKGLVCLDVTAAAVDEAVNIGADVIVCHHPLFFEPLKSVPSEHILCRLVRHGISVVAAHTNLDICDGGVGDCLAAAIGLTDIRATDEPFVRVGTLPCPMTAKQLAAHIGAALHTAVRFHEGISPITTVAVGGGSCGEFARAAQAAGAQAFLSGEIRHHQYLDEPLTLIEAGHYATEQPVVAALTARLAAACPSVSWTAFDIGEPYRTV